MSIGTSLLCSPWTIGAFAALCAYAYYALCKRYAYLSEHNVPHRKPVPFFGNAFDLMLGRISFSDQTRKDYEHFKDARYVQPH